MKNICHVNNGEGNMMGMEQGKDRDVGEDVE